MIHLTSSPPQIHLINSLDIHGNVVDDDELLRGLTDRDMKDIFKKTVDAASKSEGVGIEGITLGSNDTPFDATSPTAYADLTTLFGLTVGSVTDGERDGEGISAALDFLCGDAAPSYLDLEAPPTHASGHPSKILLAPFSGGGGGSSKAMDLTASHHFDRSSATTQEKKRKKPGTDGIPLDPLSASSDTARTKYLGWTETDLNELQKGSYLISFYNLYLKVYGASEKDKINTFFATVLLKYNELRILIPAKIVRSSFWPKLEDEVYKSCDSKFPIFDMFLRKYGFLIPLFYTHLNLYKPGDAEKFLTTLVGVYKINIKHVRPFIKNIIEIFGEHLHSLIPTPPTSE